MLPNPSCPRSPLTKPLRRSLVWWLSCGALLAACAGVTPQAGEESGGSGGNHFQVSTGGTKGPPPIVYDGGYYGVDVPPGLGTETQCNGIDDNDNGVIDDVDLGHDGVCDCLRIATIGMPGGMDTGSLFKDWLKSRSQFPVDEIAATTVLTSARLKDAMLIVVQDLRQRAYGTPGYVGDEVAALSGWVKQGGGLMTLAGFSASVEEINPTNQLLAPLGLSYEKPANGQGYFGGGQPPVKISGLLGPHDILAGLTKVGMYYAYPVKGSGQVLVRDVAVEDGKTHDMALATTIDKGRVVVWGDEWITYDMLWKGDYTADLDVPRLWLNLLKWLTPSSVCQVPIPDVIP